MDWGEIFGLSVSPWELIIRGTAMYLFLFVVFRVVIRRCGIEVRHRQLCVVSLGSSPAWRRLSTES